MKRKNVFIGLILFALIWALPAQARTPVTSETQLIGRTSTNLANDAVYTSDVELTRGFGRIVVMVEASHNSATDGLVIQQSGDDDCATATSPNWDLESKYSYTAGQLNNGYSVEVIGKCARISYTNGGSTTTTLRIYSALKTF